MFNYKTDLDELAEEKKSWQLDQANAQNQNININNLCSDSLSDSFVKMMKNGISPLNKIQDIFHENIPIFNGIFFQVLDHFIINNQVEGMTLLEILLFKNMNNVANFYGEFSVPIVLNYLPKSFPIIECLLSNSLSHNAKKKFYSTNWIQFLQKFAQDLNYHFVLSKIIKIIEPPKIDLNSVVIFFSICESLLNSPNKIVVINILDGFQDHFYAYFPQEIAILLNGYLNKFIFNNNDEKSCDDYLIIQLLLLTLSNIVTDDTIQIITGNNGLMFSFLAESLSSTNENLVSAASEFALALVSYDQAYEFLTSPIIIGHIFKLASDSLFSTRKNMILILCDLIIRQNKEKNLLFLANGVLDLLIEFLGIDQDQNTSDVLQGIQYLAESVEDTNQIDVVINTLIANKPLFYQIADNQCESISKQAETILKGLSIYTL